MRILKPACYRQFSSSRRPAIALRAMSSLRNIRAQALAATKPTPPPRDISGTIVLTPEEASICTLLDEFTNSLKSEGEEYAGVECRIAGGWVRDKLLGIPSNDIDIALANIMGVPFAEKLQSYMVSRGLIPEPELGAKSKSGTVATIGRNPEQSKHLETARMNVLGQEVDFVNLRSETYASDSRIPIMEIGTPLEDALRRDITINALFYNVHTRTVEDLTEKGISDLRNGIVRTPLASLETFRDDPLRVLRCVRFSSRFGFEIAEEAGSAMREKGIQDALILKISRERVGEEFTKMLKGVSPLLSLSTIHDYDLYTSIFGIPPVLNGKATGTPRPHTTAIHATSILSGLLAPTPTGLPTPHPELLKQTRGDHNLRQRLIFGAALTPWRGMSYMEKKKSLPLAEGVIKEGLKIGGQNHFIPSVPSLFIAHERVSKPSLDKFEGSSQRALIGLLLRDKLVHNPSMGTHWSGTLLFSLVQDLVDLVDQDSLDDTRAREVVDIYNAFTDRVLELDLVASIEEPPRLNGKEIGTVLGIKPGKEIGTYMEHVVRWQLEHPKGSLEDCKTWLRELYSGNVEAAAPPNKSTRK